MNLSEQYFERSLKIAPGGVHSPVRAFKSVDGKPIFFKKAQGAMLTSVDDKEYIDFCQSFGPLILGHRDPEVSEIVRETVEMAWSFGTCEPYSLELAEWITQRIKWVEKLRFVCSGTEAVMSALRVARAATNRSKIVKFEGCYHGHVDSLLVKAGSGLAGESSSDSAGVTPTQAAETLTVPLDDDQALEKTFQEHGSKIAAIIFEPLPANYGLLIQRKEFIQKAVDIARKNGVLIIFDEVISGFRTAIGGMAEILNITPDLVTYGKVIGGGFPVGAYGGRKDLMDLVAPQGPVYQAGTLSANPIGMRAGLATLKKIQSGGVHVALEKKTAAFSKELQNIAGRYDLPLQVTQFASIFWLHARTDQPIRSIKSIPGHHKSLFNKIFHRALNEGIYLAPSGYEVSFMSMAHTDSVLDQTLSRFEKVFKGVNG
ncbi:MAG: glutamate-1-semialdehyde 2,1-aminomutase [Oligoflexia bacterium]|nr:glutamate-1-semialdehyde 2,1-aminomutase [Oligoflexia bacterium]